jgi:hypothetical protein
MTAKEEIRTLLGIRDGTFDFVVTEVSRPDRIETSMTKLLLTAATEEDEAIESSRR